MGTTDPTYNKGFTSRLYMTKYINDIPNRRNISRRGNNNNNTKCNIFCSYISNFFNTEKAIVEMNGLLLYEEFLDEDLIMCSKSLVCLLLDILESFLSLFYLF